MITRSRDLLKITCDFLRNMIHIECHIDTVDLTEQLTVNSGKLSASQCRSRGRNFPVFIIHVATLSIVYQDWLETKNNQAHAGFKLQHTGFSTNLAHNFYRLPRL